MREVGLSSEQLRRYPHEFSGGQRQRICIARALAVEPDIVVCDESLSALDVSVQAEILSLLNDLKKKRSLSYLFIAHDMNVVSFFCDRIAVLKDGKIEELADTEIIISDPKSEYTKALMQTVHR